MTHDDDERHRAWRENARAVLKTLDSGLDAAFITIGDPTVYSTFGYLVKAVLDLNGDAKVVTVPGITAFQAASARMNLTLVEDRQSLALLSGVSDIDEIQKVCDWAETAVILKPYKNLDEILASLAKLDKKHRLILASRLGMPDENIVKDANTLKGKKIDYLSLLIAMRENSDSGEPS